MARNNCGFSPYVGRSPSYGTDGRFKNMLVRDGGLTRDMYRREELPICDSQLPQDDAPPPTPPPVARMGWQDRNTQQFSATNAGAITIAGTFNPTPQVLNFSVFENFNAARHTVTNQWTAANDPGTTVNDLLPTFNYVNATGLGSITWAATTEFEFVPGTGVLTLRDTILNIDLGTLTYSVNENGFYDGIVWAAYAPFVPVP